MRRVPPPPGKCLITIVGINGAGKSTQIAAVRAGLLRCGHRVTELPNESLEPLWERLDEAARRSGEDIEGFLGVDTVQMLASVIKWFSAEKAWRALDDSVGVVLADRYSYCQVASAQRASDRTRSAIEHLYRDFPAPDACIWLDVDPVVALSRLRRRGQKWRDLDFLQAHRRGYARLAGEHDFIVVDGNLPADEVTSGIMQSIRRTLPALFGDEATV